MTHQDFLDQVDAYALGALEPAEARTLEQHLASEGPHPLCEAALARARETVATLAADLKPVSPPPRVWEGIARAIAGGEEPATRAPAPPSTPAPAREAVKALRPIPPWTYSIAAAAVVILFLGGINIREAHRSAELARASADECKKDLAEARIDVLRKDDALQLLQEPGTQLVSLKPSPPGPGPGPGPGAPGTGIVLFNPRGRALFVGKSFQAQATRDYELWIIRDGKPIAAGLLPPGPDGRVFADVRPDILTGGRPAAFAVSVEPKGAERDAPKGPIILTGAVAAP